MLNTKNVLKILDAKEVEFVKLDIHTYSLKIISDIFIGLNEFERFELINKLLLETVPDIYNQTTFVFNLLTEKESIDNTISVWENVK